MAHKLLLADDSVTIQRVIELTFADEDVQVIAVGDGRQAIEMIQRDRPDIVLADVGMPERDGYEVAAFVKGDKSLAGIPVLLLTGAFEPVDEERAKAVGCDGVLVKPFEPQMVISRVKDLLAGRKPVSLWADVPATGSQGTTASPVQQASGVESKSGGGTAPPPAPVGSLEDYFDRLDAAFATLDGGQADTAGKPPVAPPATPSAQAPADFTAPQQSPASSYGTKDHLAGWDPDLAGDPLRTPASAPPAAAGSSAPVIAPVQPAASQVESAPLPPPALPPATPAPPVPAAPAATASPSPALDTWHAAPAQAGPMPSLAEAFAALLAAEQGQHFAPALTPPQPIPDPVIEDIVQRVIARMSDRAVRDTVADIAERLVREEIARIKGNANP
jgi:CheY-like chemotaxis protein